MFIGVPKEIKPQEYRVGLIPASVKELRKYGHTIGVESGAGERIGWTDNHYIDAGAVILPDAETVFAQSDLIIKVKEPQAVEVNRLRQGQILFTYLHLAADKTLVENLLASGCIAIAYETVTQAVGGLPLLTPMSQIAGKMSVTEGAICLEKWAGGSGVLLGGVPGVPPAKVVVLGGGAAGSQAVNIAIGLGADVAVLDTCLQRLQILSSQFGSALTTIFSTQTAIEEAVLAADLVIGAVLLPGAATPRLVSRDIVKQMKSGSVIVDIAIDQGGCVETSKPTSHQKPTYVVDDVVHYCVDNMPGAVPRTASMALNHATLPFIIALANQGVKTALLADAYFQQGLNIYQGKITYAAVAAAHSMTAISPIEALL